MPMAVRTRRVDAEALGRVDGARLLRQWRVVLWSRFYLAVSACSILEAAVSMGCMSWDVPTLSQGLPHHAYVWIHLLWGCCVG